LYLFLLDLSVINDQRYKYWERLAEHLHQQRLISKVREIPSPSALEHTLPELLRRESPRTIVAVGDDTFLAQLAGQLYQKDIAIGYIPYGPHTGFGRSLNLLETEPEAIAGRLAARRLRDFDLLRLGKLFVVESVQWGVLANLHARINYTERAIRVPFHRRWHLLRSAMSAGKPLKVQIGQADYQIEAEASGMAVLNHSTPLFFSQDDPRLSPTDGQMNLLITPPKSGLALDRILSQFAHNRDHPQTTQLRFRSLRLSVQPNQQALVDGYPTTLPNRFHIDILPSAFRLIV